MVFATVILCWVVFFSAFVVRKRPPRAAERKRDRASIVGVALQGAAYAIMSAGHRDLFTPMAPLGTAIEVALAMLTVALSIGSAWMTVAAVRTLGKEWSVTARLVEGHKLATEGPYHLVRHPIYTAMFGLLLATGLVVSDWRALLMAALVFWIGTAIRVRSEEKLLHEAFGQEFEDYARRVPAVFPRLY
jgi:protein-S-isoprenylcysteine O-methyltransferase Ste14